MSAQWLCDAYSVCACLCLSLPLLLSVPHLASSLLWNISGFYSLVLSSLHCLSTDRPMWPIYWILPEVTDGNCVPCGPKQNHKVLEKTRPLYARHAWPHRWVNMPPGPAVLVPSYGSNSFPVLWRALESKWPWKKIQAENLCRWARKQWKAVILGMENPNRKPLVLRSISGGYS